MKPLNILLVGCGDIGVPLALKLRAEGHRVWGLKRNPASLPESISPLAGDVCQIETLSAISGIALDYAVVTLTPAAINDDGYRQVYVDGLNNLLSVLDCQAGLKRLLFVSSTSVFHQCDGGWVNEDSATQPGSFSGRRLLQAEQLLAASGLPYSIVRFAGIYGPGRRRLIDQVLARQPCAREPELFTNRIHRDDCVGLLAHLIHCDQVGQPLETLYIGVDCEPVPMWQLKQWLALQLGVDMAEAAPGAQAVLRRNSKRCSNKRMLASGYKLLYPDYKSGYGELVAGLKSASRD